MNKQEYIDTAEQELLHTYNRFSLVLDHGEGVYLYDTDKKAYLDFAAGIAVCALGYSNEAYKNALKDQVDKLLHTSNLYYNVPTIEAAKPAEWIVFSLPTAVRRPLREPSKLQKNMHIPETDMPAMKSLP